MIRVKSGIQLLHKQRTRARTGKVRAMGRRRLRGSGCHGG